jgi:hypothetical protein
MKMHFDYRGLAEALKVADKTLPAKFYLVDISLLQVYHNTGQASEREKLQIEYSFFHANPKVGQWVFWETDGFWQCAVDKGKDGLTILFRDYMDVRVPSWLPDSLPQRVDQLRQWLTKGVNGHSPVVLYVHCEEGCDRTGELIGAYELRWKKMTWAQVTASNVNACPWGEVNKKPVYRQFACNNYNAAHWYCFWASRKYGLDLKCGATPIPECWNFATQPNGVAPPCSVNAPC